MSRGVIYRPSQAQISRCPESKVVMISLTWGQESLSNKLHFSFFFCLFFFPKAFLPWLRKATHTPNQFEYEACRTTVELLVVNSQAQKRILEKSSVAYRGHPKKRKAICFSLSEADVEESRRN